MRLPTDEARVLQSHPLFGLLTQVELHRVHADPQAKVLRFAKGQLMHLQHEPCAALEVLLRGKASIQRIDEAGSVLRIAAFAGGDILGANLLFATRNLYPYTVVAEADTTVLRLPRALILAWTQSNLGFLTGLMTVISDRTHIMTDKIDIITHKTIRQRVMDILLFEYGLQNTNPIRLPTSKKDLAERLGIQRTSLSREMNRMRRDGLIAFDSRRVTLTGLLTSNRGP